MSHCAENFCRGVLYCCNDFGYRKTLVKRGKRQDFPSKFSSPAVPKKSEGKIFTVEVTSDIEKVSLGSGGAISKIVLSRLSLENLLSQSADNFRRGGYFSVSKFLGIDKI